MGYTEGFIRGYAEEYVKNDAISGNDIEGFKNLFVEVFKVKTFISSAETQNILSGTKFEHLYVFLSAGDIVTNLIMKGYISFR